jgi:hypothetical protein
MGLLPVPWVVSAAGEGGALTTEAEHVARLPLSGLRIL